MASVGGPFDVVPANIYIGPHVSGHPPCPGRRPERTFVHPFRRTEYRKILCVYVCGPSEQLWRLFRDVSFLVCECVFFLLSKNAINCRVLFDFFFERFLNLFDFDVWFDEIFCVRIDILGYF